MTNSSILAAFERMWLHIVTKVGETLSSAKTYTDEQVTQKTQVQVCVWEDSD